MPVECFSKAKHGEMWVFGLEKVQICAYMCLSNYNHMRLAPNNMGLVSNNVRLVLYNMRLASNNVR